MQEWFSVQELADLALPGLPNHKKSIRNKAKREGWRSRPRQGRGGGNEYYFSALPIEAQSYLRSKGLVPTQSEERPDVSADVASTCVLRIVIQIEVGGEGVL